MGVTNHDGGPSTLDGDHARAWGWHGLGVQPMKVLLTGADGFVGQHVARHLWSHGHMVTGLNGPASPSGTRVDVVFQPDLLLKIIQAERPEAIIHLAAQTSIENSWAKPQETLAVNVEGSINVWQCAVAARVKRFVVLSSAEVYQSQPSRVVETSPILPRSPFGLSKWSMEQALGMMVSRGTPALYILRAFNLVGTEQAVGHVIPDLASQVAASTTAPTGFAQVVVRDPRPVRDFLDVRDGVRAIRLAAEGEIAPGVYNLSSGVPRSIPHILQDLEEVGSGPKLKVAPQAATLHTLAVPYMVGSARKLEMSGWAPEIAWHITLRDVLAEWAPKANERISARPT